MIRVSNNPCAKAFGDRIGWQNIESQMHGLGLSSTELSPSLYTTASDLALFLYKLENGSLLSASDKGRLIDLMKVQVYRAGIPKGTGLTVADKVGFIDSYIHDAGIVYGARGPYVLVIMTSGSSWSAIADAAAQINAFLNR
jgi:beta-lactamase class A